MPPFRGLEPRLSLSYDSARGLRNGSGVEAVMGIGWRLEGLSHIDRVSGSQAPATGTDKRPGGFGTGVYSDTYATGQMPSDNFLFDGVELYPCNEVQNQLTTPTCTTDGADTGSVVRYAPRVETFVRLRRDTAANKWEVTSPDGIKSTYQSLEATASASTYQWFLTKTEDKRGNHIDYIYTNVGATGEFQLRAIKYYNTAPLANKVAQIDFDYDHRPDDYSYSDGQGLRSNTMRLRSIDVSRPGARIRAYHLSYEWTGTTHPSRLVSVQQFGSDASVAANGAVTGPTTLPPYVFSYADKPGFQASSTFDLIDVTDLRSLDFNGDGRGDALIKTATDIKVRKLTATGYSTVTLPGSTAFPAWTADFNADGRDDLMRVYTTGSGSSKTTKVQVEISDGTTVSQTDWASTGPNSSTVFDGGIAELGDFNGDGRQDILTFAGHVWLANTAGTAFDQATSWTVPTMLDNTTSFGTGKGTWNSELHKVGDFNGDGKAALIINQGTTSYPTQIASFNPRIYLSNGETFIVQAVQSGLNADLGVWPATTGSRSARSIVGDVNGDGSADLVMAWIGPDSNAANATRYFFRAMLSRGKSFAPPADSIIGSNTTSGGHAHAYDQHRIYGGDFNGDGLMDLVYVSDTADVNGDDYSVAAATPASHFATLGGYTAFGPVLFGDFNGDGKTDYVSGDGTPPDIHLSGVASLGAVNDEDLLITAQEPLGGKTTVEYGSSAATGNLLPFAFPVVKSITTDDGRGVVAKSDLTYTNGKWNFDERQFMGFQTQTTTRPPIRAKLPDPRPSVPSSRVLPALDGRRKSNIRMAAERRCGPRSTATPPTRRLHSFAITHRTSSGTTPEPSSKR